MIKNIVFAASECVPFIKTGGLADVVGALPKMFPKDKYDVRVIMPNYLCIPWEYRQHFQYVHHFYMDMGSAYSSVYVGIMTYEYEGIRYYFIDNERYFGGDKPYGNIRYDIEKFTYFCKAVMAVLPVINFQPDIIHCHDWQTGLIPAYLGTIYRDNGFYWKTKAIMTIHNLRFQGIWDVKTFKELSGLPDSVFTPECMEYKKDGNMLKAGMVMSSFITTVSHTYAGEIQSPFFGEGLDGVIRTHNQKLCGIVNGIDYDIYNPQTDTQLYANYGTEDFRKEKIKNKRGIQRDLGLPVIDNKMLIGIISRLTDQKGLDLVEWAMEGIVDRNVQFVVIGTGDEKYENFFRHYEWKYKERVSANIYYSESMAHKLYAGADAILLPSQFEPCGLTQLIAMRYGTIPIVRETGGLRDTVEPYNEYESRGTGFTFANYNGQELLDTVNYAKRVYFTNRSEWDKMAIRCMETDYSWNKSAVSYQELYDRIIGW